MTSIFLRDFYSKVHYLILMTIWVLALILLGSCAAMGLRQGVIRVAFSFVGIVLAALLAVPLGALVRPLIVSFWAKDPIMAWAVPPLVMFLLVSILFKIAAAPVHRKVDVYMKYHAGDLRLVLWQRLSAQLGLCLGLLNGAAYLILLSLVIFAFGYWTVQVGTSGEDPKYVRLFNTMGRDLEATGFSKVARSIDRLPDRFYQTADVVGLVYANPLLEARLGTYPAFLGLAERTEFRELSTDTDFIRIRQGRRPIQEVIGHPKVQAIIKNPGLLRNVWTSLTTNLDDLKGYLATGRSPKYDSDLLLGRWRFNVNAALSLFLKSKPNVTSKEMQRVKGNILAAYGKARFLATTEKQAILKSVPPLGTPLGMAGNLQNIQGTWRSAGNNQYELNFPETGNITAGAETDRLRVTGTGFSMIFNRE